ncbi:MAG: diguanylate cyclase [Pararhodobacter sp.]|nr:diguanylate cyclase [Pararhodobacter sp.]
MTKPASIALDPAALGEMMPMFLWIDRQCRIRSMGPTLRKLAGPVAPGTPLEQVFELRRPRRISHAEDLVRATRIRLNFASPPRTGFKGVAVPLAGATGALLNLSFGYGVRDAVREHALSDTDFAPTDLAIELLYLAEAKAAVMAELDRMNQRLLGAKKQAEAQALTDTLTGLGNRRALERQMQQLLAAGSPFGLMHVDLDRFKQVNDTLGHAAGDHVLVAVAAALRQSVRGNDLVARVGGDEFIILLPTIRNFEPIRRIGRALLARLETPIPFDGHECRISASIGAVLHQTEVPPDCPDCRDRRDALLARADKALYLSKHAGRSRMTMLHSDGTDETVRNAPCRPATPVQGVTLDIGQA